MPSYLLKPVINRAPLAWSDIERVARQFDTSLVSTAIRSVQLSDFPSALFGIRDGAVQWSFISPALVPAGIYPRKRGMPLSLAAQKAWGDFLGGSVSRVTSDVRASQWLQIFREPFQDVWAKEQYFPAPILSTLMVLVTIDEADLMEDEEPDFDEDDD